MSARILKNLSLAFGERGALAAAIPGYRERAQQLEMAFAILDAIERNTTLCAEAGTGTGKTVAYLVPALLAGGKVIISTGTKTLQDQLFDRDLPAVRKALAAGASTALLKGRANYVCLYRLRRVCGSLSQCRSVALHRRQDRASRIAPSGSAGAPASRTRDGAAGRRGDVRQLHEHR